VIFYPHLALKSKMHEAIRNLSNTSSLPVKVIDKCHINFCVQLREVITGRKEKSVELDEENYSGRIWRIMEKSCNFT
jgi:hypothetical protein